ncbi:MAG: hypothetical protein P4L91_07610 [Burkholderiaceae bacterium]|nr:hypothetical protein [Burkholderiaceae bacterium]
MIVTSPVSDSVSGFRPLAPMLQAIAPAKLAAVRERVAGLDRDQLLNQFRVAFDGRKRLVAFIVADELTARGVPPCFRLSHSAPTDHDINQNFDLFLYDVRWIRCEYLDHKKLVRYERYRELFSFSETNFHRAAEYVFWQGHRPSWKIVASLGMTDRQQWDCVRLRSAPVAKRDAVTKSMRREVFEILQADLRRVRRTKTFTNDDATATLLRRHDLWVCSRMTASGGAAEVATRYFQLTGKAITRDIAKRQIQIVNDVLNANRLAVESQKRVRIV